MERFFHSVTLDESKCKGCINCIKRCPTEAIRVRNGKATILAHRCIDCGECIRVCPHHAKKAICDKLSDLDAFEYKIALPAPSFYGQFNNLEDVDILLSALKAMGFDQVFEVSKAAELVSDSTRRLMRDGALKLPGDQFRLSGGGAPDPGAVSQAHRPCSASERAHGAGGAHSEAGGGGKDRPAHGKDRGGVHLPLRGEIHGGEDAAGGPGRARWTRWWPSARYTPRSCPT